MTRGIFFSLVKETLLRRVGRYHFLITVELKSEKREKFEGNIVRMFSVVFSVEEKNVLIVQSTNGSCFKEFTKHTIIFTATTLPFPPDT